MTSVCPVSAGCPRSGTSLILRVECPIRQAAVLLGGCGLGIRFGIVRADAQKSAFQTFFRKMRALLAEWASGAKGG